MIVFLMPTLVGFWLTRLFSLIKNYLNILGSGRERYSIKCMNFMPK
jgi:hypothetical protein